MADLLGIGSLAAGVGSLMGGFGGSKAAKKSTKEAKRQFNIQMNESIQRRVADAREAGIHPLFALGASVGASPTMFAGGSSAGGGLGEGIAEAGRAVERYASGKTAAALASAQIRSAEAQAVRDEADAQLSLSRAKKLEQDMVSRGHDGARPEPKIAAAGGQEVAYGPAEYVPPQIPTSKRTGVASGTYPGTIDVMMPDGRTVNLYAPDLGMDELNQLDMFIQRMTHKGTDAMVAVDEMVKKLSKSVKPKKAARGRRGRNARNQK